MDQAVNTCGRTGVGNIFRAKMDGVAVPRAEAIEDEFGANYRQRTLSISSIGAYTRSTCPTAPSGNRWRDRLG